MRRSPLPTPADPNARCQPTDAGRPTPASRRTGRHIPESVSPDPEHDCASGAVVGSDTANARAEAAEFYELA
jgi:hypothetical protein